MLLNTGFETFETDSPIWLAIDNAFKTYVLNANTTTDTIKYYYEKVCSYSCPLCDLILHHSRVLMALKY